MERKKLISRIDRAHTTPEQQAAIDHHIEQGYRITNMKETLLHSVVSFTSLEEGSYAVDKALKEKIGNRAKILFGYAISSGNECPSCGNYFKWAVPHTHLTLPTNCTEWISVVAGSLKRQ